MIPGSEQVPDFTYFDGVKTVHGDRLAIFRQLLIRTRGKPNALPDRVFAVKPDTTDQEALMDSWEASEELVQLVRDLFQMAPFNSQTGQGARDEHCWSVWDAFCESMSATQKKTDGSPTSAAATESPPAPNSPPTSTSA